MAETIRWTLDMVLVFEWLDRPGGGTVNQMARELYTPDADPVMNLTLRRILLALGTLLDHREVGAIMPGIYAQAKHGVCQ